MQFLVYSTPGIKDQCATASVVEADRVEVMHMKGERVLHPSGTPDFKTVPPKTSRVLSEVPGHHFSQGDHCCTPAERNHIVGLARSVLDNIVQDSIADFAGLAAVHDSHGHTMKLCSPLDGRCELSTGGLHLSTRAPCYNPTSNDALDSQHAPSVATAGKIKGQRLAFPILWISTFIYLLFRQTK